MLGLPICFHVAMSMSTLGSVPCAPLFLKNRDISRGNDKISSYDICKAAGNVIHDRNVDGAQLIRGVWKLYTKSLNSRMQLLSHGLVIKGISIDLHDDNPYVRQKDDQSVERIIIKDLPIEIDKSKIEEHFKVIDGLELKSQVRYSKIKDSDGQWTNFKNGDRFVYALGPIKPPLDREAKIEGIQCRIFHDSQEELCKACRQAGHKTLAEDCPAKCSDTNVLAFRTFQHPLSNHYQCKIRLWDREFNSSEHAYLWQKAMVLGQENIADEIKYAKHAGAAKAIARRHLDGKETPDWLQTSLGYMREVLEAKLEQCEEFHAVLVESKDQLLAEATQDIFWGTGHGTYITSNCKQTYWPGQNMLGEMLMNLRCKAKEKSSCQPNPVVDTQHSANTKDEEVKVGDVECDAVGERLDRAEMSENDSDEPGVATPENISPSKAAQLLKMGRAIFGSTKKNQKPITDFYKTGAKNTTKKRHPTRTPPKDNKRVKEDLALDQPFSSPFVEISNPAETGETSNHPPDA